MGGLASTLRILNQDRKVPKISSFKQAIQKGFQLQSTAGKPLGSNLGPCGSERALPTSWLRFVIENLDCFRLLHNTRGSPLVLKSTT